MKKLFCLLASLALPILLLISCEKKPLDNNEPDTENPGSLTDAYTGAITGVVKEAETGKAIAGIEVATYPLELYTKTDVNGKFSFGHLPPSTRYYVFINDDDSDYENAPVYFTLDGVESEKYEHEESGRWYYELPEFSVEAGKIRKLEFHLEARTGTIHGAVKMKGGDGVLYSVYGAEVELLPVGIKTITTGFGQYSFEGQKRGSYTLKISAEGYQSCEKNIDFAPYNEDVYDIELEVEQAYEPKEPSIRENFINNIDGLGLEMVYVQGGTFAMDNRITRLDSYHIGKYEITQKQWRIVMGEEASADESYGMGDDYPVYNVSWEDAQKFCEKLSELSGDKYVLPTEAQWEYAAKGGRKTHHYSYSGSDNIEEIAWYGNNSGRSTHPVGMKKANELGIHDMSGNAYEWCSDWYADLYNPNDNLNPQGPASGSFRVGRGGSGWDNVDDCQVWHREYGVSDVRNYGLGFRVAVVVKLP